MSDNELCNYQLTALILVQSNLDYQDLWGLARIVRIIESLDNRKYEYFK